MKQFLFIFSLLSFTIIGAQSVTISKMANIHENKDKHLYKIEDISKAEYLGEIEIGGFSNDDALMFSNIYSRAKKMGANAFKLRPIETIDGKLEPFDPNHYFLSVYYMPSESAEKEENNIAFLIGSPTTSQKIGVNQEKITIPERSFKKIKLNPGEIYTISTLKFLGSSIKLTASDNENTNYFQVSGFKVKSNPYGQAGINLKSGDIIRLEKSYGMFLTTIYQEIK